LLTGGYGTGTGLSEQASAAEARRGCSGVDGVRRMLDPQFFAHHKGKAVALLAERSRLSRPIWLLENAKLVQMMFYEILKNVVCHRLIAEWAWMGIVPTPQIFSLL